jgi:2',3'-cyclic-nucleotide 2'-phosphodiesterase (5'-nucleotidase family)
MRLLLITAVAVAALACRPTRHIAHADAGYTAVNAAAAAGDPAQTGLIAPYKVQLDSQMNEVIAVLGTELVKRKPEGTMGNWTADALLHWLDRGGYAPDMTVLNYGGQRVPSIQPGPLTIGEIYELSPFDNMLVVVEIPGDRMQAFLSHIAAAGGWPVSEGVRMVISRDKLGGFQLRNQPLDTARTYRVGMPDYVANGGDRSDMLIGLKQVETGVLVRDVLIDEARRTAAAGREIHVVTEARTIIEYP